MEAIIDRLLSDIEGLVPENERAAYSAALLKAKSTIVAQDKIALVKDMLPPVLRPDGINPLAVLHDCLSDGIHSRDDMECLEDAEAVRESLVFLIHQVLVNADAAKTFTAHMRKLLEKKASRKRNAVPEAPSAPIETTATAPANVSPTTFNHAASQTPT